MENTHKEVEIDELLITESGLPLKYQTIELDSVLAVSTVRKQVVKYCAEIDSALADGIGVVLVGPSPSGKTTWASYLLRFMMHKFGNGYSYAYTTPQALTDLAFNAESRSAFFELQRTNFLVLDEVDTTANAGQIQSVQRILKERDKARLLTFVSTGLTSSADFGLIYGASLWRTLESNNLIIQCPSIAEHVRSLSRQKMNRFKVND